ncbi:hypothetical protein K0U00_18540, partial [Paenibacillus sepulcri]|nr:hypothetical protein [Paenibacillus sepulcri]
MMKHAAGSIPEAANSLFTENGYYGSYGGSFIPEILVPAFAEINRHFEQIRHDEAFWQEYCALLADYSGRPT